MHQLNLQNHEIYGPETLVLFSIGAHVKYIASRLKYLVLISLLLFCPYSLAQNDRQEYLNKQFDQQVPKAQRFWVTSELKKLIAKNHNPSQIKLSYRYWKNESKTVWILDEIGKERNITTGISIENHAITSVEVITYRESRGGQVQNKHFTSQYLQKNSQSNFSKEIDSISGATLSVWALNKQAKLALWLNQQVEQIQH